MLQQIGTFILEQFGELIVTIVTGLIGIGFAYLMVYIKKFYDKVTENINNDILNKTINRLEIVSYGVVNTIEENTAKFLRDAVKSGAKSREELLALGEEALINIKKEIGQDALLVLEQGLGDVDTFIQNTINSQLENIKLRNALPESFQEKK